MKALLPLFSRPSHYLGTEINSVHKDPATVRAHVALAFPDLYEVAMSYLGQKILYDIVNACEDFYAERVFAPTEDVAAVLRLHDDEALWSRLAANGRVSVATHFSLDAARATVRALFFG